MNALRAGFAPRCARARFEQRSLLSPARSVRRAQGRCKLCAQCARRRLSPPSGRPAATELVLEQLIHAGVDICRLNFSHGSHDAHAETLHQNPRRRRPRQQGGGHPAGSERPEDPHRPAQRRPARRAAGRRHDPDRGGRRGGRRRAHLHHFEELSAPSGRAARCSSTTEESSSGWNGPTRAADRCEGHRRRTARGAQRHQRAGRATWAPAP